MKTHTFIDVELSSGSKDFVQFKSPDSQYLIWDGKTELNEHSVDLCLCLFSVEKLPNYGIILDEAKRVLKTEGKLLIFFKNKRSFYGMIYFLVEKVLGVKSISAVFPLSPGPYEPVSSGQLVRELKRKGFSIEGKEGLFFVPAEILTFSGKLDGYLKRHGKYMNSFRFLIKPAIRGAIACFYLTRRIRLFSICSSCLLIANSSG